MPDWPVDVNSAAMAENYARYLVPSVLSVWAIETLQHTQARPNDTVLDVACGTGVVAFDMAQLVGPYGRVVGIDNDPGMLAIAERIRRARDMNQVQLREMDAHSLKYPDGVFDHVVCQHALMYFDDRPKAIREMMRVLSHSGRMVITAWGSRANTPHEAILGDVFRAIVPVESSYFDTVFSVGERGQMETILREAGVKSIAVIERVQRTAIFPSAEAYWQGVVLGRPIANLINSLPEATAAAIKNEVFSRIRPFKDQQRYIFPMEGVIVAITKP
jgi:ubiquinone/menaquinone biosynthesis C-methylase UbiE